MKISKLEEYLYKIKSQFGDLDIVFDVDNTDNLYSNADIIVLTNVNDKSRILAFNIKREHKYVH